LVIVGREVQAVEVQIPEVVQTALVHVAERLPENPELQTGVHVVPLAEFNPQFPDPASAMTGVEVQAVLLQVPESDHTVFVQVAESVPENPELHTGVQVDPLGEFKTQSPTVASIIEGSTSHAVEIQVPETDQAPEEQVAEMVPAKPELQAGEHVDPLAAFTAQSPAFPFATEGKVEQGVPPTIAQAPEVDQAPRVHVAERVPANPI
jgi:hypothetical protein